MRTIRRTSLVFTAGLAFVLALGAPLLAQNADAPDPLDADAYAAASDPLAANAGTSGELTGTLEFIWGDAVPLGSLGPQMRCFLHADDGEDWQLDLDEALVRSFGGASVLNLTRVVVTGTIASRDEHRFVARSLALERTPEERDGERSHPTGSQPYLWILLRFGDDPNTPHPSSWFETQALGPYPSLDDFWRETSYEIINLTGTQVAGWYTLPHPRSYYVYDIDPNDPDEEVSFNRCRDDAVALADPDVYFPDFIGVNLCFNGYLDCCAWGGTRDITADGVTKVYGMTWMPINGWNTQGVLAHEMGHALSLPHSSGPYGDTYDSQWDVMSGAYGTCAVNDPVYGCLGTQTIGYHKDWLGWIEAARRHVVGATPEVTTLTLHDLAVLPTGSEHQYVRIPQTEDSFYTIEARRLTGYDQNVPAAAVVMHLVDYAVDDHARVVDVDGNGNCNDAGAQWQPGETFCDAAHGIVMTVDWATASDSQITFTNAGATPVYVDYAATGYEDGSAADPWNTIREGYGAVLPAGTVYVRPGTYTGVSTYWKPATLVRNGASGTVILDR